MRDNEVKRALAEGSSPIGLMVFELAAPGIARMARSAGAAFVLYDMEHSGWSGETMKMLLDTTRAAGVPGFVRVPDSERNSVSLLLDLGALGLMLPMVETGEQARRIAEYARYAPQGSRGVGIYHADDVEPGGLPATLEKANREIMVIAQIETARGVEHVEEIAAVDGIDVLWIGHFDLTTSLGTPGEFWNDAHTAAVDRVLAAGAAAGKPVGTLAGTGPADEPRSMLERGFRMIALGDAPVLGQALNASFGALRD